MKFIISSINPAKLISPKMRHLNESFPLEVCSIFIQDHHICLQISSNWLLSHHFED